MEDIQISISNAFQQAKSTADDYLGAAIDILDKHEMPYKVSEAIEVAKVMAQDFHTAMMCMKLQEIRDAITKS